VRIAGLEEMVKVESKESIALSGSTCQAGLVDTCGRRVYSVGQSMGPNGNGPDAALWWTGWKYDKISPFHNGKVFTATAPTR
jgi:hypothetical protein